LIHNFYILKPNGISIFYKNFGSSEQNLEQDPQNISNFLTAISLISKQMLGESIKTLMTTNFKFVFRWNEAISLAIFTDIYDDDLKIRSLLREAEESFFQYFPRADVQLKNGNVKQFESFGGPLTGIIENNCLKVYAG